MGGFQMKEISNKKRKKKGFTLIELIIVIAIIGILAVIAVPKFAGIQQNSKIQADIASGKVIHDAVAVLMAENKLQASDLSTAKEATTVTEINNYLQKQPTVQNKKGGKFMVKVTSDNQIVVTVDTDTNQVYPTATGIYAPTT